MDWLKEFQTTELVLIVCFFIFYMFYFARIILIARKLNTSFNKVFFKLVLRSSYFALFIVALLGPTFGQSNKELKAIGKDIYICVDLSQSMSAFDIQPSRLEKVKYELKNIVAAFQSDRIGLIIFSSEAFVQCGLTYDHAHLNLLIETLNTGLVPNTGTEFGPPMQMALSKIDNEKNKTARQSSKIIMLISDGEDFGENTSEMAEKIKDAGIKLFTLGIGTAKGGKIRTKNGFKRDNQNNEVISKLNPKDLKVLAASTGGKYFEINESKNDIDRLINSISNIKGELRESKQVDVSVNKYYYFLGLALLLLCIDLFITLNVIRI